VLGAIRALVIAPHAVAALRCHVPAPSAARRLCRTWLGAGRARGSRERAAGGGQRDRQARFCAPPGSLRIPSTRFCAPCRRGRKARRVVARVGGHDVHAVRVTGPAAAPARRAVCLVRRACPESFACRRRHCSVLRGGAAGGAPGRRTGPGRAARTRFAWPGRSAAASERALRGPRARNRSACCHRGSAPPASSGADAAFVARARPQSRTRFT
jgi:hypothetical protein